MQVRNEQEETADSNAMELQRRSTRNCEEFRVTRMGNSPVLSSGESCVCDNWMVSIQLKWHVGMPSAFSWSLIPVFWFPWLWLEHTSSTKRGSVQKQVYLRCLEFWPGCKSHRCFTSVHLWFSVLDTLWKAAVTGMQTTLSRITSWIPTAGGHS